MKYLLFVLFFSVCVFADTPLQAYVYMAGNGSGGGTTMALDNNGQPLPVGSVIQFIWAGSNEVIDPPAMNNFPDYTSGDDVLQADLALYNCTMIGDDFLALNCTNAGEFSGIITGTDLGDVTYGRKAYVRAWNSTSVTSATKYGNCELVTISVGPSDPIEIQQLQTSKNIPLAPELGYVSKGLLSTGTVFNDSVGRVDFSFRVLDFDGSDDYSWYFTNTASFSYDGTNWFAVNDEDLTFYAPYFTPATNWGGMKYTVTWHTKNYINDAATSVWFRFKIIGKDGQSNYGISPPFAINNSDQWLEIIKTEPVFLSSGDVTRLIWHASMNGDYRVNLGGKEGITLRSGQYIVGQYITNEISAGTELSEGTNVLTIFIVQEPSPTDNTRVYVENKGNMWSFITKPVNEDVAPRYDKISGRAYSQNTVISAVKISLYDTTQAKYYDGVEFASDEPCWLTTSLQQIYKGNAFTYDSSAVPWRNKTKYIAQSKAYSDDGLVENPNEQVTFNIDLDTDFISLISVFPRVVGSKDAMVIWVSESDLHYTLRLNDPDTGEVLASGNALANVTNYTQFICATLPEGTNKLYITAGESGKKGFELMKISDMSPVNLIGKRKFVSTTVDDDGDLIYFTYIGHPESKISFNGRIIYLETIDGNGKIKINVNQSANGDGQADIIGIWCNNSLKMINCKGVNLGQFNLNNPYFIDKGAGGCKIIKLSGGVLGYCPSYGHIENIMDNTETACEASYVNTLMSKSMNLGKTLGFARADILTKIKITGELKKILCRGGDIGVPELQTCISAANIKSLNIVAQKYSSWNGSTKTKNIAGGNLFANVSVAPGNIDKITLKGGSLINKKIQCAGNIINLGIKSIGTTSGKVGGQLLGGTICAGVNPITGESKTSEIKSVFIAEGMDSYNNNFSVIASGVYRSDYDYEGHETTGIIKKLKIKEGASKGIIAAKSKPELKVPVANDLIIYLNGTKE